MLVFFSANTTESLGIYCCRFCYRYIYGRNMRWQSAVPCAIIKQESGDTVVMPVNDNSAERRYHHAETYV